jgi:hypothetical protein
MDATLYTANGGTQAVANTDNGTTGFKPDLVWVKMRSGTVANILNDSNRGVSKPIYSNLTNAEGSQPGFSVTAFNSNGFTVVDDSAGNYGVNGASGQTFVGWQWQAGQGTNVSNTSGTITSSVSANTTAGFSIVTYTGNFTTGATVGHGLGVAPQLIIVKKRSAAGNNWITYHVSTGVNQYLYLNATDVAATATPTWGASSSTFTLQQSFNDYNTNGATYVAYCWAPVAGFSQFGSYTGNGSADGPFVYLGFRPRWIMFKAASGTSVGADGYWNMIDTSRGPFNYYIPRLAAQSSAAEDLNTTQWVDILSNGFKMRNGGTSNNNSGTVYIYAAFAENPFKYANAR